MRIRPYQDKDEEDVISLWRTTFPSPPPHNEPVSRLRNKVAYDKELVFVAEDNGKIIGAMMAGYDGYRGWLYSIAVEKDHRRNGIGTALTKHAISELKALGCTKINIQIYGSNSDVVAFYNTLGFVEEDRISMGLLLT